MFNDLLIQLVKKGRLRWQKHALERMLERDIYRSDVISVLENGEIIEEYSEDYPFPSVLILGYKEKTDAQLLFDLIEELKDVDQFFIQKAIGWALREYSKLEPLAVVKFANTHQLTTLAEREALKIVRKNK